MRLGARLVVLLLSVALCSLAVTESAWATTNWLVHVASTNAGQAKATTLPARPRRRQRRLRGAHHIEDGHGQLGRRHPRHDLFGLRVDDVGDRHLHGRRQRDNDHVVDKRHLDRGHQLLVRGRDDDRHELDQREIVSQSREHHEQLEPLLRPSRRGGRSPLGSARRVVVGARAGRIVEVGVGDPGAL